MKLVRYETNPTKLIVKMTSELNIPFDQINCCYCVYRRFLESKKVSLISVQLGGQTSIINDVFVLVQSIDSKCVDDQ